MRKLNNLATPILSTWSSESNLFSMILTQEKAMEWVLNNYMNLICNKHVRGNHQYVNYFPSYGPDFHYSNINGWTACPFLEVHFVSHYHVKSRYANILEYMIRVIEEGYCVEFDLNQEKLKTRMGTAVHGTFFYGYDMQKRILHAADHYDHSRYARVEMGFEELLDAYDATYFNGGGNGMDLLASDPDRAYEIRLITLARPREYDYKFNMDWFKIQLKDYLNATYTLDCLAPIHTFDYRKFYFGIECYDVLMDYLAELPENGETDWKPFMVLQGHKKLLRMRADFFREKGICSFEDAELEQYDMLVHDSEVVKNFYLKYLMTEDVNCLERMRTRLGKMKAAEVPLLQGLLAKI